MKKKDKVLASLCYFSFLFFPCIFSIIIWIKGNKNTKIHAKRAFVLSFAGYASIPVIGWIITKIRGLKYADFETAFYTYMIGGFIGAVCLIWSIINGIKVLKGDLDEIGKPK